LTIDDPRRECCEHREHHEHHEHGTHEHHEHHEHQEHNERAGVVRRIADEIQDLGRLLAEESHKDEHDKD